MFNLRTSSLNLCGNYILTLPVPRTTTYGLHSFYLVNKRMRIKRDIGKGQLCTRGGYSEFSVGCAARFFKSRPYFRPRHAIFFTFIRSRGSLENYT